jgi:hypothetical protein
MHDDVQVRCFTIGSRPRVGAIHKAEMSVNTATAVKKKQEAYVTLNELGGVDRHLVLRQNVSEGGNLHKAVTSLSVCCKIVLVNRIR